MALLNPSQEDLDKLLQDLRAKGMTDEQVKKLWERRFTYLASKCRRAAPPPEELLQRFRAVCSEYKDIVDDKTKEKLFSPKV